MSALDGKRNRYWIPAGAIVCLCLSAPAIASSMWCEPPGVDPWGWAESSLSEADTVILGRVYSIKEIPQEEPEPASSDTASSMAGLLENMNAGQERDNEKFDHVISFDVLNAWKEPIHPVVRTRVFLGSLARYQSFQEGEIYLIAGRDLEDTLYRIEDRCRDAIREEWAAEYIASLDDLAADDQSQ